MRAKLQLMLDRLLEREDLAEHEAGELLAALAGSTVEPALAGALLAALRAKGVTAAELRGFATAMRTLARKPPIGLSLSVMLLPSSRQTQQRYS